MASVQHYVCDAENFPLHVIKKHATLENIEKVRHFAALKIQRLWRGYVVRKEIALWNYSATVLQKYIRRWLVLWHLPQIYLDYLDWYSVEYYNGMATKIQSLWRGYMVRKDRVPVKELLARRLAIEAANENIKQEMKDAFANMEKRKKEQMEVEAREWVIYFAFKLHHHLRTRTKEGIYSNHGHSELSHVEKIIKSIPFFAYMKKVKQIYYKRLKEEKLPPSYIFKDKKLHRIEDEYRNTKKVSEKPIKQIEESTVYTKRFSFDPRPDKKIYERFLLYTEKYSSKPFDMNRTIDKSKHISKKDFDLHVLKKTNIEPKLPPYYMDLWNDICQIHNIP